MTTDIELDDDEFMSSIYVKIEKTDYGYVAKINHLPDCTEYADTVEEAMELAKGSIETTYRYYAEKGFHDASVNVNYYTSMDNEFIYKAYHYGQYVYKNNGRLDDVFGR